MMNTYLVGGAVRDIMLGVEPKDRDYVVVGATEQDMLSGGFEKVGADFPVFLKEGEEYALARREKKTGAGYLGFETDHGTDVTLEEDLSRRDLTINAMAMGMDGFSGVVDPFNGLSDLDNRVLRHTSDAFKEDPVRVLRIARFRARYGAEWTVAPETVTLVNAMAKSGVLAELTAERVWKELSRALMEAHPRLFFDTLLEMDALHVLFPEVYRLKTALEAKKWHPEGDAYEHTMLVLTQAAEFGFTLEGRYSALVHDFGKGLTPRKYLPSHHGHDKAGVPVVEEFSKRLTVPAKMTHMAMLSTRYHMYMHKLTELKPQTFVKMFMEMRGDVGVVTNLLQVGMCDERGRLGSELAPVDHLNVLMDYLSAYKSVNFASAGNTVGDPVEKIQERMMRARSAAIKEVMKRGR